MRPIERGPAPGVFTDHKDARDPLIQRIGDYCSYCENALPSGIDVEHVRPKSLNPDVALNWPNFLLACGHCNSIKGHQAITIGDYFWPDTDNTSRAFKYELDQPPSVGGALGDSACAAAQRTLELTGLDRAPGHPDYSDRDRRWFKRKEVWGVALLSFQMLQENDTPFMRQTIVFTAQSRGFWSVWMTVFQHDHDMRRRFIAAFPGTAVTCFAPDTTPIARPGGSI